MSLVSNHHNVESKLSRATGVAGAASIRSVEVPGRFSGRELPNSSFVGATDERQAHIVGDGNDAFCAVRMRFDNGSRRS